jgi:hypothetical protein
MKESHREGAANHPRLSDAPSTHQPSGAVTFTAAGGCIPFHERAPVLTRVSAPTGFYPSPERTCPPGGACIAFYERAPVLTRASAPVAF